MKKRILFLCTGNSARSLMAEALLRNKAGSTFDVYSAGTAPAGVDSRTLEAMKQFGLATEGLRSKPVSEFAGQHFDFVITLCDKVQQECSSFPAASETLAWDFEDPKMRAGLKPFDRTLKELNDRINMFVLIQNKS